VMALWSTAMIGSTFIGGPAIGWIGEFIGARSALAASGFAAIAAVLVAARFVLRHDEVREVPESVTTLSVSETAQQIRVR